MAKSALTRRLGIRRAIKNSNQERARNRAVVNQKPFLGRPARGFKPANVADRLSRGLTRTAIQKRIGAGTRGGGGKAGSGGW